MNIQYEITSHSRMVVNGAEILNEINKQRWKLGFKRVLGTYNFHLMVKTTQLPRENSGPMNPLYGLLDIIDKPTNELLILVDGDKEPVKILNHDDVMSKWENAKSEILDTYGQNENNLQMVQNLEASFDNYIFDIKSSLFFNILLGQWKTKKKWIMRTGSIACQKGTVEVEIKNGNKKKNEHGEILWQHLGEGELTHRSKAKKTYDKEIKEYSHADFDYNYRCRTIYTEGEGLPGIDLFNKAVTLIREQASNGFIYFNKIEFDRI